MDDIEFNAKLDALTNRYAASLPAKIAEISKDWDNVLSTYSADNIAILLGHIHTLTGSSSTFGFTKIGDISKNALEVLRSVDINSFEDHKSCLQQYIVQLENAVNTPQLS